MNELTTTKNDIRSIIIGDKMKAQFNAALPKHLSADRFCRVALTALTRTPKLAECTPESLMRCLLDLSAYGIEPDGRRAHLIPFENRKNGTVECTLILDWKGLAELAMRSGVISKLHADIVCENDIFDFNLGEIVQHKIDFKKPRGDMYAAYAMAVTKDGPVFVQVLSKDEIDGVMKRSQGYKSAVQYNKSHPWLSDYNEMAKKTAFRRLAKWLPLSAEFRDAVENEDDDDPIIRDVTPPKAEASKLFQALTPVNSAAESSTVPAGGAVQTAESFTLDAAPPNKREIVASKLVEHGLQWADIADMLVVNGLLDEPREVLADCSDDELIAISANWNSIVKLTKEARK